MTSLLVVIIRHDRSTASGFAGCHLPCFLWCVMSSDNKRNDVDFDAQSGDDLEGTAAPIISPHTGVGTHDEESQSVSADEVAVDAVPGANDEKKSEPSGDVVVGVGLGDLSVTDEPAPDSGVASNLSPTGGTIMAHLRPRLMGTWFERYRSTRETGEVPAHLLSRR